MATGSTVNVAVNVTAPGLSQANTEAQQLHSSLKGAATAAAAIRVATPVRTAQASMPGATDTNLSRGVAGVTGASGRDFAKQAQNSHLSLGKPLMVLVNLAQPTTTER